MDYQGNDFYCDVAIPGKIQLNIAYEDLDILAFHHTRPHWPIHIVVIPKRHIPSLLAVMGSDYELLTRMMEVTRRIAREVVDRHGAARVLTNLGTYQDSKHLHFHVCFGDPLS